MPGNPYSLSEGDLFYDDEVSRLALDKNIIIQFFIFLKNLVTGNWGNYYYNWGDIDGNYIGQAPISELRILDFYRFLELIFASTLSSLIIGIGFGYLISKFKNKKKGKTIRLLIILLWAIPVMGFGYLFSYIFARRLRWLPGCSGISSHWDLLDSDYITNFPLIDCLLSGKCFWDRFLYLITPVSTLNLIMIPVITYFTYKLIEHFKSSQEIPDFTGKLGFFYNIIVTSTFFIYPIVCTYDLSSVFLSGIFSGFFNWVILSFYFYLIIFFIFNFLFNIIISGIALYLELKKGFISKDSSIKENSTEDNINSNLIEDEGLKSPPKKKLKREYVGIIIATAIISLLVLIVFLLLRNYFIIFLGILVVIICFPLIIKSWRLKLISKKEIESNHLNTNQKPLDKEEITIKTNGFSKWLMIIGGILIIISIFGIGIYGWDDSGNNLFKTQTTLIICILGSLISITGVLLGFLSAYYGKWVKKIINNLTIILISIPSICILYLIIGIIEVVNFRVIWIIGLISIPIVAHFTQEIISNEMKKISIKPVLSSAKIHCNSLRKMRHNLLFPILGVLCLNVCFSIFLYEGLNSLFHYVFLDPSYISLGRSIATSRSLVFGYPIPSSPFLLFIPSFLLFLIVCGFMLLGLGLYDYKLKKKTIQSG
jgi:ABC-type dipeptide/oligopeptide/nickel transport system permease component